MSFLNKLFPMMLNIVILDKVETFKMVSGNTDPIVSNVDGNDLKMKCTNNFQVVVNGYTLNFRATFTYLVDRGYEYTPKELLDILDFSEIECYTPNGKLISPAINIQGERAIIKNVMQYLRYCDYHNYNETGNYWETV